MAAWGTDTWDARARADVRSTPERITGGGMGSLVVAYELTDCGAFRSAYGQDAGAGTGEARVKDGIEVEASAWWDGTRAVALQPLGPAVGDLVTSACLAAGLSIG